VLGSNLGWEISYPEVLVLFQANAWTISLLGLDRFLPKSLPIDKSPVILPPDAISSRYKRRQIIHIRDWKGYAP
jgi:hypothetical protein